MPSFLASAGAGAAQGLEALIKRKMMEDQLQLQFDKERNDTSYRNRSLDSLDADRKERARIADANQQSTQADRLERERTSSSLAASTEADRIERQKNAEGDNLRQLLPTMPKGLKLSPQEADRFKSHDVPSDMFPESDEYKPLPNNTEGPSQDTQKVIRFRGIEPKASSTPVRSQVKTVTLNGKPVDANYDPVAKTYEYKGQDITKDVEHFEKPDNVLIQSGSGYMRRSDAARTAGQGGNVPLADTTNTRNRREISGSVGHALKDVGDQAIALDGENLFGPVMSRIRHLAEKAGTIDQLAALAGADKTGDQSLDYQVGKFATSLSLAASGAGMAHYQGRAGSSQVAMNAFKEMLSDSGSLDMFLGRLDAMEGTMARYSQQTPSGGAPPAAGSPVAPPAGGNDPGAAGYEALIRRMQGQGPR